MSNLYDFSKNAWHVKFFKWMWGINPVHHYKTMCPYFWQYVGSIIILPFILIFKLFQWMMIPLRKLADTIMEARVTKIVDDLQRQIMDANTDLDYYKIYKSKCWYNHSWKARLFKTPSPDEDELFLKKWDKIKYVGWKFKPSVVKKEPSIDLQKVQDNLMYGIVGKVIGTLLIAGLVYLVGWGTYEFVHLFTMDQFLSFMTYLGMIVAVVASFFLGIYLISSMADKLKHYWCDTWLYNIVFWKPLGKFFSTIFYFIFVTCIWTVLVMFVDMIKNFYHNQCPVIHWQDEE